MPANFSSKSWHSLAKAMSRVSVCHLYIKYIRLDNNPQCNASLNNTFSGKLNITLLFLFIVIGILLRSIILKKYCFIRRLLVR